MRKIALILLCGGVLWSPVTRAQAADSQCVVLLHGLARSAASMGAVHDELLANGYRVVNQGYPSRSNIVQLLPNPDDGKVSVSAAKVAGMTDFIALPVSHPPMMNNKEVLRQILAFLAKGRFNARQKPATAA